MDHYSPIEIETGEQPVYAVIWLHGLGASGNDFVPIVQALQIPKEMPTRFIFPHALMRPITINGGVRMRGWYDLTSMAFECDQDLIGIKQSSTRICEWVARENDRNIPCENIILAGFSQGGAMALYTGLRLTKPLAGIIALSAYLPFADALPTERTAANQQTPIFIAHGVDDPLIPIALAQTAKQQLAELGYSVIWQEYPIAHTTAAEEIEAVADFLRAHLPPID